jgi:lipoyl(octanoyl) transferase
MTSNPIIRQLGSQDYLTTWQKMKSFTDARNPSTLDEIWLLQHPSVYTQGQAGKPEHILNPGNIPITQTDRGGQVTYHGPGQLVIYVLLDLTRLKIGIRQLVTSLENSVIQLLEDFQLSAKAKREAPGVYVNDAKICSIGLRVRKGHSYHGLAFNIDMDLEPFSRINPCGFRNLPMTQLTDLIGPVDWVAIETKMIQYLTLNLM